MNVHGEEYFRPAYHVLLFMHIPNKSLMRRPLQTPQDKVLWNLVRLGGNLDREDLRVRMNMRFNELGPISDDWNDEVR